MAGGWTVSRCDSWLLALGSCLLAFPSARSLDSLLSGNLSVTNCFSTAGRPPPSVIWMKDGVIIDDSFTTVNDRSLGFVVENELLMKHLSRSDIDSVISCEAINSNLTSRTSATVSLDLSCKFSL